MITTVRGLDVTDSLRVLRAYVRDLQGIEALPPEIEPPAKYTSANFKQLVVREWELVSLAQFVVAHARHVDEPWSRLSNASTFSSVCDLWTRLEEEIYAQFSDSSEVFREMGRLGMRQFFWQRPPPGDRYFSRYAKIYNTHALSEHVLKSTGYHPDSYLCSGVILIALFLNNCEWTLPLHIEQIPDALLPLFREQIDHLGIWMPAARRMARESTGYYDVPVVTNDVAYKPVFFAEKPVIFDAYRNTISCPFPIFLSGRAIGGLDYQLRFDNDFANHLGDAFEEYVGSIMTTMFQGDRWVLWKKRKYGTRKRPKETIDWIMTDDERSVLLVECKAVRIAYATQRSVELDEIKREAIEKIGRGVAQIYRQIEVIRSGVIEAFSHMRDWDIHYLIVTLEEWYLFPITYRSEIVEAAKSRLSEHGHLDDNRLDSIVRSVLSVDELENFLSLVKRDGIRGAYAPVRKRMDNNLASFGPSRATVLGTADCPDAYPFYGGLDRLRDLIQRGEFENG